MSVTIECPRCHRSLALQAELADAAAKYRCSFCGQVFRIGREQEATGAGSEVSFAGPSGSSATASVSLGMDTDLQAPVVAPQPLGEAAYSSSPAAEGTSSAQSPDASTVRPGDALPSATGTNVSSVLTGIVGLIATILLYLLILRPIQDTYVGTLLVKRGRIQYAIMFLAAWSTAILLFKWLKLRRQMASLLLPVIPENLGAQITRDNAGLFRGHVRMLLDRWPRSFLLRRVLQGLDHFQSRQNVQEVTALLESQSYIDATAVESSYSLLKVFIWTIPILGFIGTVMGIGQAVGGFSGAIGTAQDLDVIKSSLASVTSGLAVAFDTTLLALVVSVLIMFPVNGLQKSEEDLLSQVDQYCNEHFVRRLGDGAVEAMRPEAIEQAIARGLARHGAELDAWRGRLEAVGETVTRQVVSGWEKIHQRLQEDYQRHLGQTQNLLEASSQERGALMSQAQEAQEAQMRQAAGLLSAMTESAHQLQGEIAALQQSQVRGYQEVVSGLADRLDGLQQQMLKKHEAGLADQRQMAEQWVGEWRSLLEQSGRQEADTVSRLDRVAASLADQAQQNARDMLAARKAHVEWIESTRELHETARKDAQDFAREQIRQLSEATQTIVLSLGPRIEAVHQAERQAAAKSAAEHLSHVTAVGNGLVASLVGSQRQLDEHMKTCISIMESQGTLSAVQSSLASNLELLGSSDAFKRTLGSIDRNLVRLHAVLEGVRERAGLIWPDGHEAVAPAGGPRRSLWQRLTGGDAHG